jgi:hypothetical protein
MGYLIRRSKRSTQISPKPWHRLDLRAVRKTKHCLSEHMPGLTSRNRFRPWFTHRTRNRAVPIQRQHQNRYLILRCIINAHSNLRRLQLETIALSPDQDLADIARADIAKEYPGPQD